MRVVAREGCGFDGVGLFLGGNAMSAKEVHAKCVVCGGLVHIGHDGEMAMPRLRMSGMLDVLDPGGAKQRSEVAIHNDCRVTQAYNRRGERLGRRKEDVEPHVIFSARRARDRMNELRSGTPRERRRLMREWFGKG